jgi:hypothetical protein
MSIRKRLNGITQIPQEYLCEAPPCPKSVKIELTAACNYKCHYCGYSFRKDKRPDMDMHLFEKITRQMKDAGVTEIGLFYIGEPFMRLNDLVRAIRFCKQELQIPYVFITSNASLASPSSVRAVMDAGLDSLKWSVNACNEEQFIEMMNTPIEMFGLAKHNIKEAFRIRNEGGYQTKLYASSIMYDKAQPDKAKEFLEKHIIPFVDEHYWLPLYTMGGVATGKERELGLQPVAGNPGRCDSLVEPIPCWTLFTAGHVLADGRLTGCCMDATGNWVMGDLNTTPFMECWHSEDFKALRREHLKKNVIGTKCAKCALVS